MTDFADWMRARATRAPSLGIEYRDALRLCAQQHEFIAKFNLGPNGGGFTFKEAAELVRAAEEFQEKYA